jgi:beta-hydroxylase
VSLHRKDVVVKILRPTEWEELARTGAFAGSPDDLADGFIHLSTVAQLEATLARHFSKPLDHEVVLVPLDLTMLGEKLRWERSRGGALFPHFFGVLKASHVVRTVVIVRDAVGHYVIPDGFLP